MMPLKDTDTDWRTNHGRSHFGYSNYIVICKGSILLINFEVTKAIVHDSQPVVNLICMMEPDQDLYADSVYQSEEVRSAMTERNIKGYINKKKKKGKDLKFNQFASKTRSRIMHIFADIRSFGGNVIQTIGME